MIILDTSALSHVFRRAQGVGSTPARDVYQRLIADGDPLTVPGIVLQEILSGIREPARVHRLARLVSAFPLCLATQEHHFLAATLVNDCLRVGVAISSIDALIAATTLDLGATLFTLDTDFEPLSRSHGLRLVQLPG